LSTPLPLRTLGDRFHRDARVYCHAPDHKTYARVASFNDPEGDGWLLQKVTTRLPDCGADGCEGTGSLGGDGLKTLKVPHGSAGARGHPTPPQALLDGSRSKERPHLGDATA
jgi:hypothetical protein